MTDMLRLPGKDILLAAVSLTLAAPNALGETRILPKTARFCPSWAEAHERTLASLIGGRAPYSAKWKGCIWLKRGAKVELVSADETAAEIILKGKHWFADEGLF
jgi:hypothetical protein